MGMGMNAEQLDTYSFTNWKESEFFWKENLNKSGQILKIALYTNALMYFHLTIDGIWNGSVPVRNSVFISCLSIVVSFLIYLALQGVNHA